MNSTTYVLLALALCLPGSAVAGATATPPTVSLATKAFSVSVQLAQTNDQTDEQTDEQKPKPKPKPDQGEDELGEDDC